MDSREGSSQGGTPVLGDSARENRAESLSGEEGGGREGGG